jgi:hypothetical protein
MRDIQLDIYFDIHALIAGELFMLINWQTAECTSVPSKIAETGRSPLHRLRYDTTHSPLHRVSEMSHPILDWFQSVR